MQKRSWLICALLRLSHLANKPAASARLLSKSLFVHESNPLTLTCWHFNEWNISIISFSYSVSVHALSPSFVILFPTSLCLSSHWPQSSMTEEEGEEESVGAGGMGCFEQKLSGEKNERREWHCEQCLSQLWCVNWWQVGLAISMSEIMFLKEELIARKQWHDVLVFGCLFFSVCVCSCGVLFLCIHLNLSF